MLFRHGTDKNTRATERSGGSHDPALKEMRNKARRRLIGALVLVLAAVIVVPWLFETPAPQDTHAPMVVPATPQGLPPDALLADGTGIGGSSDDAAGTAAPSTTQPATPGVADGSLDAAGQPLVTSPAPTNPEPAVQTPPPVLPVPSEKPAEPVKKPVETPAKPAPKPTPKPPVERTDDGSVALALLAGKSPIVPSTQATPPKAATTAGRYYLQVAAYGAESDAQARRDSLRQAGVSDAYVARGTSNGRTVYRLRVGPFSSHEAAQAAQTRLRALGYQNGLISDK